MRRLTVPCVLATAALTSLAAPAKAGDFVDARLSFALTCENFLAKPGETVPSVPGCRFGAPIPRWGTLFFDNYDTRFYGFENLSNLVLYKKWEDGQSEYEGGLVLRLNEVSDVATAIYDGGSYMKWTYWLDPAKVGKNNLSVTAFPMSSDRMRLGYSYRISWGGSPVYFKPNPDNPFASSGGAANTSPVPGAKVQLAGEKYYAYIGLKSSVLLDKKQNEQQAVRAILAGAGWDLSEKVRLEANGGFFDRGTNPKQEVLGTPVQTFGGSAQATYHEGIPVGRSADFALMRNDPSSVARVFQPEEYPGGLTWLASAEFTGTGTTLMDSDRPGSTTVETGFAGDLNVRVKWNNWRFHADFMSRDLSFLLMNVPSFVPYVAMSTSTSVVTGEKFGAVGVDYYFAGPQLTLGFTGGMQMPATYQGTLPKELKGNIPEEALPESATVVVRSEGNFDILPAKAQVLPIIATKTSAVLQRGNFSLLGEFNFSIDNNATHLERKNNEDTYVRKFNSPLIPGVNLAMQMKW